MLTGLLAPFLTPFLVKILTDFVKRLIPAQVTTTLPPGSADLISKGVATAFSAVITLTNGRLPISLGPILDPLQPLIVTALTSYAAMLVHDASDWLSKAAGNAPAKPVPATSVPGSATVVPKG